MTIAMCGYCEMLYGRPQPDCANCKEKINNDD